jgi:endonuclease G, mitochondrial
VNDLEQRLATAVAAMEQRDPKLGQELKDKVRPEATERVTRDAEERPRRRMAERVGGDTEAPPPQRRRLRTPETIVLRTGRPVLTVKNDSPELLFRDTESEVWRERLQKASEQIHRAVLASGRVEVEHHPTFNWIGTGWLVREDVIVTNRHVAKEFARRQGTQFRFRPGTLGRTMRASMDFLEEFGRADERTFQIKQVLHIEGDTGPDMALLKVEQNGALKLAAPIGLSPHAAIAGQQIATIGYPARDSRIPEMDLMEDIFGDVFDKKRLAPGQVIRATKRDLQHDCSTLGGNSGSTVLDLESGDAVGLHFAGRFLEANFAVPAAVVQQRLNEVVNAEGRSTVTVGGIAPPPVQALPAATSGGRQVTLTIPLRITIDIGDATGQAAALSAPSSGDGDDDDTGEDQDDT